jgi:hypothetical protein
VTIYVYRWNRMGRKGQRCIVLTRGTMNSCKVRFEDGHEAITSRNALKKAPITKFGDQPIGSDLCACGDYRSQHERDGKCRVCFASRAPYDGCTQFRFSRCAVDDEVKHWWYYHGTRVYENEGRL